nr:hypothetical protein [Tanacetum cinerariifolium]
MDNPNSPNEPNEDIPEENPVIPEPNHVEDAHDPNEMVDNEDLVDYDRDDEEPEKEPEQQIGHENQFAQHPNPQPGNINEDESSDSEPPRYESSDFVSSDFESEDEEADITPEATVRTALRRDLETSRARARLIEAELSTTQAKIALLKLKVLVSGENATLKKKLAEKEMQLVIARMDHASAEGRLHESIGWNRRFYMEMVRKGAVPKPSSEDESTERPRKKSKKPSFDGTEGPSEPRGPPSDSE